MKSCVFALPDCLIQIKAAVDVYKLSDTITFCPSLTTADLNQAVGRVDGWDNASMYP